LVIFRNGQDIYYNTIVFTPPPYSFLLVLNAVAIAAATAVDFVF